VAREGCAQATYGAIPDGYLESRMSKSNLIKDPKIAKLYDQVRVVTPGRLLSADRFRAIWRLNMPSMDRRAPAAATALLQHPNTFEIHETH
jgi:hypothetical protein